MHKNIMLLSVLLLSCGSGRDERAAEPDTAAHAAAQPATRRQAQKAWDTADSNSFDVEEGNRRRRELEDSLKGEQEKKLHPKGLDTLRLLPSQHPSLNQDIAMWLEKRGYLIPEYMFQQNSNVRTGDFVLKGQEDIAVLALRDSVFDVLVFENRETRKIHTVKNDVLGAWGLEMIYQKVPDSTVKFLYGIEAFGENDIRYYFDYFYWPEPPELAHDALNLFLLEDSSAIFYYHKDKWQKVKSYVEECERLKREGLELPQPDALDTLRIYPSEHPLIPKDLAVWLEQRGYLIPQSTNCRSGNFSNVLIGEFVEVGQRDLAVLATKDQLLQLMVFENSETEKIHTVKGNVAEQWKIYASVHSAMLLASEIKRIGRDFKIINYTRNGEPKLPEINQDAIEFCQTELASSIYYYFEDEWFYYMVSTN